VTVACDGGQETQDRRQPGWHVRFGKAVDTIKAVLNKSPAGVGKEYLVSCKILCLGNAKKLPDAEGDNQCENGDVNRAQRRRNFGKLG